MKVVSKLLLIIIVVTLVSASAMGNTRIRELGGDTVIEDTDGGTVWLYSDGTWINTSALNTSITGNPSYIFDGNIHNSNGNNWTATWAHLQDAIDDCDNGTVYVTSDLTTDGNTIEGKVGVTLDFLTTTVIPGSSHDLFNMSQGFSVKNLWVNCSGLAFTNSVFFFDGADKINHDGQMNYIEHVGVYSTAGQGIVINMTANAANENVCFVHISDVYAAYVDTVIYMNAATAVGTAFINGNYFNDIRGRSCINFIELNREGAGTNQLDGNIFEGYHFQYGGSTNFSIRCDANNNYFNGFTWDADTGTGSYSHRIEGNHNIVYDYMNNVSAWHDTGTDNLCYNRRNNTRWGDLDWEESFTMQTIGNYISFIAPLAVRLQHGADGDVYMFSSAGSGENPDVYVYGRNDADTGVGYGLMDYDDDYFRLTANTKIVEINDILKLKTRTTYPTSPVEGMIFYNTTDNTFYGRTGAVWQSLNDSGAGVADGNDYFLNGTVQNSNGNSFAATEAGIQAAIDDLIISGTVYMPNGTISLTAGLTLDNNIKLVGAGVGATILQDTGGVTPITVNGKHNVTLSDFTVDGNNIGSNSIYVTGGSENIRIKNIKILNTGFQGIYLSHTCDYVYISDVHIIHGDSAASHGFGLTGCNNTVINDCILENYYADNTEDGIDIAADCCNITLNNIIIRGFYDGIKLINCLNININNLYIYDDANHGIKFQGDYINVNNFQIIDEAGGADTGDSIWADTSASHIHISNGHIIDSDDVGITIGCSNFTADNVEVDNPDGAAFTIGNNQKNIWMTNCKFYHAGAFNKINSGASNIFMDNLIIAYGASYGISADAASYKLMNSIIEYNGADGIDMTISSCNNYSIIGCTFRYNDAPAPYMGVDCGANDDYNFITLNTFIGDVLDDHTLSHGLVENNIGDDI